MRTYLLVFVLLAGCGGGEARREAKSATAQEPPVPVHTTTAAVEQWPLLYEATGTVRARTSAVIAAKWMGTVREVKVQTGDHVQAAQVLVTLDSRDLDANLHRSEAAIAEIRSAIPEADSAIAAAKANLDLAQATFTRMQDLWNKKSISNQEFDEATARLKAAQAGYEMARARRGQIDSQAARAQQDLKANEITRTYAEITAPFAGVVTAKSVDPGALATPGAPLLTLERDGALRLEASVDESHLATIRAGQPVTVVLDGIDQTFESRVSEVVPSVDAASRSYIVKIDLPMVASLRAGVFGRARFALGARTALAIPAASVTSRGQLQSVIVADQGIAHTRLITTGEKSKDRLEVLSGLSAGESIVLNPPPTLADGARVEVRQ